MHSLIYKKTKNTTRGTVNTIGWSSASYYIVFFVQFRNEMGMGGGTMKLRVHACGDNSTVYYNSLIFSRLFGKRLSLSNLSKPKPAWHSRLILGFSSGGWTTSIQIIGRIFPGYFVRDRYSNIQRTKKTTRYMYTIGWSHDRFRFVINVSSRVEMRRFVLDHPKSIRNRSARMARSELRKYAGSSGSPSWTLH